MEAMRQSWTDDRLDYLNHRVDDGFKQVDRRLEESVRDLRSEMRAEFARIHDRLDGIQQSMIYAIVAMTAAFLAGFGGIAALIASQI
jgi:hypothetical protein